MSETRGTSDSSENAADASNARTGSEAARGNCAVLIPLGDFLGKPDLPLDKQVTTIGSRETCRLRLTSRTVSKAHALMIQSKSGLVIAADLASREGVIVNGKRQAYGPLRTGDRVKIGKFTFRFRAAPGVKDNAAPPPAAPPAALAMEDDSASVDIPGQTFLIGRRANADLPLMEDPSVSTAHAVLFPIDGVWYVRDLHSRTGTRLNGKAVHQQRLEFGDTLQIGSSTFRFHAAETAVVVDEPAAAEPQAEVLETSELAAEAPLADLEPLTLDQAQDLAEAERGPESETEAATGEIEDAPAAEEEPLPVPSASETLPTDELEQVPEEPVATEAQPTEETELELLPEPTAASEPEPQPAPEAVPAPSEAPAVADDSAEQPQELIFEETAGNAEAAATPEPPPPEQSQTPQVWAANTEVAETITAEPEPLALETAAEELIPLQEEPPAETPPGDVSPQPPVVAEDQTKTIQAIPLEEQSSSETAPAEEPPTRGRGRRGAGKKAAKKAPAKKKGGKGRRGKEDDSNQSSAAELNTSSSTVEMIEPTEPTPESAQALEPSLDAEPAASEVRPTESLTDSAFGRAVEDFAQPSTGPLNETPAAAPGESSQSDATLLKELSELGEDEEFVAIPEPEPELTNQDSAAATEAVSKPTAVAPEPEDSQPLELTAEPTIAEPAEPISESATTSPPVVEPPTIELSGESSSNATLGEPAEPLLAEPETTSLTGVINQRFDVGGAPQPQAITEATPETADIAADGHLAADVPEPVAVSEEFAAAPPATPPEDSGVDEPVEPAAAPQAQSTHATPPPPPVTSHSSDQMLDESALGSGGAAAEKSPNKPSIFGFNFDGGSFIGGVALQIPQAGSGTAAAAPTETTTVSDKAASDVGFNAAAAGAAGPATVTASPPPPMAQGMAPPGALDEEIAEAPSEEPPAGGAVQEAAAEEPGAPIPDLSQDIKVPPLTRPPVPPPPRGRRPLSTAFDGLSSSADDGGAAGMRVNGLVGGVSVAAAAAPTARPSRPGAPGAEAFAQAAPQISVELFGSLAGNPDEFVIPEVGQPAPPDGPIPRQAQDPEPVDVIPGRLRPRGARPTPINGGPRLDGSRLSGSIPPPTAQPARRMPVSILLGLMVLTLAVVWVGIYLAVPPNSKVTGSLAFANLDTQPVPQQRQFASQQLDRLRSSDVRTVAKDMLVLQHVPAGFLENTMLLDEAITHDGSSRFDGNSLTVTTAVSGTQEEGRAQMNALLLALSKKDADLIDAQKRAQRHADEARAAVTEAQASLAALNEQHRAEQKRGDDRPDPAEIAVLEAASNQAARLATIARAARLDAEAAMTDVRNASTTQPADQAGDRQLLQLQWQLNDLQGQIHDLQSNAGAAASAIASNEANGGNGGSTASGNAPAAQGAATGNLTGGDDAGFLQKLQERAAAVSKQITDRQAALAADQTYTPAERERAHQKQLEDMGVQLAEQKQQETDATAAAEAASERLRQAYNRLDNARAATVRIDQLISDIRVAQDTLKQKSNDADAAQQEVDSCVTVAGEPEVSSVELRDNRPIAAGIISGFVLLVFCSLILRATHGTSEAPAGQDDLVGEEDGGEPQPVMPPVAGSNGQPFPTPQPMPPQPHAATPVEVEDAV